MIVYKPWRSRCNFPGMVVMAHSMGAICKNIWKITTCGGWSC
jgi:hypothetical protein